MFAAIFVVVVLIAFVIRLFDIQVVRAQDHIDDSLRIGGFVGSDTLFGVRGSIVDDQGNALAQSTIRYRVAVDPVLAGDINRLDESGNAYVESWGHLAGRIGDILDMPGPDIERAVAESLDENPANRWLPLKADVSTQQYRDLVALGAPMLSMSAEKSRSYLNGAVGGNLVGFMSSDDTPLAGYELLENQCLQETDGKVEYQKSGDHDLDVMIPGTMRETPPVDGGTLHLTIDSDLSWYLLQMLKEEVETQRAQSGTITVLEVATGDLKAAVEYPTLDPNDPTAADPADRGSRIFSTTFEPGSTFKAVTTATLLDQGKATPLTQVTASSHETFPNGAAVGDAFSHPAYNYTLTGAMIDSSNVAMSKIGDLVDPQTRHDYLEAFGVGTLSSIEFIGEEPGILHPAENWDNQTHYTTTFGQTFTTTIPQVLSAYQTLANGGVKQPVHIVDGCELPDGTIEKADLPDGERVVSEEAAQQTVEILENVSAQGTLADQTAVPGYRIAAKTGTAQKSDGQGGYKRGVFFTSLIGMAPAEDPQYIVMVTLDEPRRVTSSAATAPAFQKAMTQVLKTYRVPPSEEPFEPLPKFTD
nr:penicillin-binding protein 2 [Microbacterium amylolyticum]